MPYAEVDGARLHYATQGTGPPVLFLHGTGASSFIWERSIADLQPGCRLITYDRRGFGASQGILARSLRDHVDDGAALLQQLGAVPAAVVTQSGGSPIALALAIAHPKLVSALVMAEPAYQVALHPSLSVSRAMGKTLGRWLLRRDPEGAALGYYRWASRFTTGGNGYDTYPEEWRSTAIKHARATLHEVVQLVPPWPRAKSGSAHFLPDDPSHRRRRRAGLPTYDPPRPPAAAACANGGGLANRASHSRRPAASVYGGGFRRPRHSRTASHSGRMTKDGRFGGPSRRRARRGRLDAPCG
jgi:pimeloyl-ACP methyl ester carboxylesterase